MQLQEMQVGMASNLSYGFGPAPQTMDHTVNECPLCLGEGLVLLIQFEGGC